MGIVVEFNPDLALRDYSEFENGNRSLEECLPEEMVEGEVYSFLKKGHRNYFFEYGIPLMETKGNGELSKPRIAEIQMIESTHFLKEGEPYTKGLYKVLEIFTNPDKIYFEGLERVGSED
ncbi:hypothetical protein KY321_00125 [Candidatus Woesearchaeota archaeon]|nr:hypothetical protein [Candidatus Woesearchaeota archaeon]